MTIAEALKKKLHDKVDSMTAKDFHWLCSTYEEEEIEEPLLNPAKICNGRAGSCDGECDKCFEEWLQKEITNE